MSSIQLLKLFQTASNRKLYTGSRLAPNLYTTLN